MQPQPTSPGQTAPPNQAQATPQIQQPKSWPDALSRASRLADRPAVVETPPPERSARSEPQRREQASKKADVDLTEGRSEDSKSVVAAPATEHAAGSRSVAPARSTNTELAKRRVVVTSPIAQPAPNEAVVELPVENTRRLFDFFGDEPPMASRETDLQSPPRAGGRSGAPKPRSAGQRRPDDVSMSDRAPASPQGHVIVVQPADAPRDRGPGGFFDLFGSFGRDSGHDNWRD